MQLPRCRRASSLQALPAGLCSTRGCCLPPAPCQHSVVLPARVPAHRSPAAALRTIMHRSLAAGLLSGHPCVVLVTPAICLLPRIRSHAHHHVPLPAGHHWATRRLPAEQGLQDPAAQPGGSTQSCCATEWLVLADCWCVLVRSARDTRCPKTVSMPRRLCACRPRRALPLSWTTRVCPWAACSTTASPHSSTASLRSQRWVAAAEAAAAAAAAR